MSLTKATVNDGVASIIGTSLDDISKAQPGDLLHFPGHVAMYIGNMEVIHAVNKGVSIAKLSKEGYWGGTGKKVDRIVRLKAISSNANTQQSPSASKTIANGTYVIASKLNNDYVLDIDGASKESKANLQLWKANGTGAQTFKVSHYKDGYYQIINTNSGKALDVYNNDKTAGTNVWQYNTNNTDAQLWEIKDAGSGYYYIVGKGSGLYLDVEESKVNSGTNILVWTPHYGDNQKWKFVKASSNANSSSSSSSSKPTTSQSSSTSSTSIKFELESVPKGNLKYGKSFSLKGWFRSDSAIVEARAYMLDANQNVIMEAKGSSTTSNYKIQGYKLDKGMQFSKLNPGGYYLKYYVKDANGDTATWISDKFYIVK